MGSQKDHNHKIDEKTEEKKSSCQGCGCCGPTGFEFPEEFMTPEIKAMQESMSPEEFEAFIKALM